MLAKNRFRRTTSRALIAALVMPLAWLTVSSNPAAARSPDGPGTRGGRAIAPWSPAARTAQQKLPAPPRPATIRPKQRVVPAKTPAGRSGARPPASQTTVSQPAIDAGTLSRVGLATVTTGRVATGAGAPGAPGARTLILYDSTGPYAWLGEVYATQTANLASHFGSWTARPVGDYTAGEVSGYTAVVYLGSTYDEPLPVAFLDDVLATSTPVIWAYDNLWQLTARQADFQTARGFIWRQFDFAAIREVSYRGKALTRDSVNAAGLLETVVSDPAKATVLATAIRPDGTGLPWAVRSGNLTYVAEIPYAYVTHDDRYLAFSDLLFDALAPATPARHRALVRIEDVGPDADPAELRAIGDYLYSQRVPFTVAVYPRYRDPRGVNNGGRPADYTLWQRPRVVSALKYLRSRGGTLLMHGYTHQYGNLSNPYDGVSGNDFEFYAAHVDATDRVIYDGPVAGDSESWAASRIAASGREFLLAGLPQPTMFEFPHYAGSAADYRAVSKRFSTRYDRGLYFPGGLSGTAPDHTRLVGQFFPYPVRDTYGTAVVPENIGNVEPEAYNTHPARLPADLIASAERNLVVRDGYASFFYHPYLGTEYLKQVVSGIKGLGYTFVPASAVLAP